MGFNSNGQIQYLILDSLSNGSKYGLEIIEFISQTTGGNYIMKKPTLYSCLTRMEKKGLVSSSYWGDSEFGGKRHYYTITNQGRKTLEELAQSLTDFDLNEEAKETQPSQIQNQTNLDAEQQETPTKPVFLQQKNIFDFVKEEKEDIQPPAPEKEEDTKDIIDNQLDIFSLANGQKNDDISEIFAEEQKENIQETEIVESQETQNKMDYYQSILEQESQHDDARFLDDEDMKTELTPFQEEQNKKLYDTSSELKRYRKKRSFAENQIEMSVVYEKAEDAEIQKSRIEQLKQSMLNARQNSYETASVNNEKEDHNNFVYKKEIVEESPDLSDEEVKDDAIFITNPVINENEIPVQKKITPPNIEVNIYDDNLPAPKRNSNLEPTYKDMMAKLFERKKEKNKPALEPKQEVFDSKEVESFADFDTLKKYYASHGIEFKEYKKTNVERKHNTNFLNFVSSTILFLISSVCCGIFFAIISGLNLLKTETNFMFYTAPILFLIYGIYTFIKFKCYPSRKANLTYNSIINWAVFIMATLVVFVSNIASGMQFETMNQYLTSLLIPITALLIAFPINYYTKKILYKKYSK